MSEEPFREFETSIRKSKVAIEDLKKNLENLDRKNAELFSHREIPYKEYCEISTKISTPSHQILDQDNLSLQLDNISKFAKVRTSASLFAIDETLRSGEWIDLFVILKDMGFSLSTLFEKPLPSIDITGVRVGEQSFSKVIDNLLYTYTPFKLRGAQREDYMILLLPSIRGDSIARPWFTNEVDYFYENGIKVITPDEVHPIRLNEIRDIVYINGENYFKLEIDRRIANGAYYCKMGQYISSLRRCNRQRECQLWSACYGIRFWSRTSRSFYSIAKVSPNIEVKVDNYEKPETLTEFEHILTFEKIDNLLAKIYIESVTFMSRYMVRNPLIRLKETIGYRINTKSIAIAIDASWLKNFVKKLLRDNSMIYTWIYTKYFIWNNFDVNDVTQVSRFFWKSIGSKKDDKVNEFVEGLKAGDVTEDLILFGCKVLLHTLSHVMHEEIVATLQTASDNIIYAYSQESENDGKFRIFLFENAARGLGLTESFASRIKKGGKNIVMNMISKATERVGSCSRELISTISAESVSKNVKTILEQLDLYNRVLNTTYGIQIPTEIARYILAREDSVTAKLLNKEDVSAFIDDILSTLPLCWDGCYQCVRLETDCHESPYEQMFLLSKHLLMALLNEWQRIFEKPSSAPLGPIAILKESIVEIGEARNLFNYIMNAKESVILTSPWISEQVAKTVCDLAIKKKLKLKILTSMDLDVETHRNALKIFLQMGIPGIEIRILQNKQLHAKMVLVDKSLLIVGSANLTFSGLYENIESYAVLSNPETISESLNKFEKLWSISTPLKNFR